MKLFNFEFLKNKNKYNNYLILKFKYIFISKIHKNLV